MISGQESTNQPETKAIGDCPYCKDKWINGR